MPYEDEDYTKAVRELNDLFRSTFIGGRVVLTMGVQDLPVKDREAIVTNVRTFHTFDSGMDPHEEHDFGAFDYEGQKVFFKIDYYDPTRQWHSEDASDPSKTVRVLTIMLAEEY